MIIPNVFKHIVYVVTYRNAALLTVPSPFTGVE